MTVIVGALNEHGIAIAADSAGTFQGYSVDNLSNKLHPLTKEHSIVLSVTGSAMFNDMKSDKIFSDFIDYMKDKKCNKLKDYADRFITYLEDDVYYDMTHEEQFIEFIGLIGSDLIDEIFGRSDQSEQSGVLEVLHERIDAWMKSNKHYIDERIDWNLSMSSLEENLDYKNELFAEVDSYLQNYERDDSLICKVVELFIHEFIYDPNKSTKVVIAGYGEKDDLPDFIFIDIKGYFLDKLFYNINSYIHYEEETKESLFLLGSGSAALEIFIKEVNMDFIKISENIFPRNALSEIDNLPDSALNEIVSLRNNAMSKIDNLLDKNFDEFADYITGLSEDKLINIVELLAKISALKNELSLFEDDAPDVAEPIDVAFITKKDGFKWVKNKNAQS